MGKLKKPKKFRYNVDRKKQWKKMKKEHVIENPHIRKDWKSNKPALQNFRQMGISYNPNIGIGKKRDKNDTTEEEAGEVKPVTETVKRLMADAANVAAPKTHVSEDDQLFCADMIDRYGTDYKAMSRDPENIYQLTKKQIMHLIEKYNRLKQK